MKSSKSALAAFQGNFPVKNNPDYVYSESGIRYAIYLNRAFYVLQDISLKLGVAVDDTDRAKILTDAFIQHELKEKCEYIINRDGMLLVPKQAVPAIMAAAAKRCTPALPPMRLDHPANTLDIELVKERMVLTTNANQTRPPTLYTDKAKTPFARRFTVIDFIQIALYKGELFYAICDVSKEFVRESERRNDKETMDDPMLGMLLSSIGLERYKHIRHRYHRMIMMPLQEIKEFLEDVWTFKHVRLVLPPIPVPKKEEVYETVKADILSYYDPIREFVGDTPPPEPPSN